MAWSTGQLADLAGTTLRTIRHYHDVGLLAEPERRANGCKSYGVPHLVRVLRISVLLVQNERAPATPLAGALTTRRAFGDRAAILTVDQGGHGAYVIGKNKCANDEVTEYLLGGQRPNDTKCDAETS